MGHVGQVGQEKLLRECPRSMVRMIQRRAWSTHFDFLVADGSTEAAKDQFVVFGQFIVNEIFWPSGDRAECREEVFEERTNLFRMNDIGQFRETPQCTWKHQTEVRRRRRAMHSIVDLLKLEDRCLDYV